jgi:hypothetical protein
VTGRSGVAPTRGLARLTRIGALGGASMTLAAVAHVLGGGMLPTAGILLVTGLVVGISAVTLTSRRCRFGVLAPVLALQQPLLHWVFTAAAAVPASCVPAPSGAGHHGSGLVAHCAATVHTMGAGYPMSGGAMWLTHGLAIVLTAWLLARGEAWLWRTAVSIVEAATATLTTGPAETLRRAVWSIVALELPRLRLSPAAPRGPPLVSQ